VVIAILLFVLSFTQINADCTTAIIAYTTCTANFLNNKCDCLKTFVNSANSDCTGATDGLLVIPICTTNILGCSGVNCDNFCGAILDKIPGFKDTFDACSIAAGANLCTCYDALTVAVNQYSICSLSKETTLSACVRAQLDCSNLNGQCNASVYTIPLNDLKTYFEKYADKFKTLWNNALATAQTIIDTVVTDFAGSVYTWKLTVNWQNGTTIDVVVQRVKEEFSKTVGLKLSDITATYTLSSKRSTLANSGEIVLTTAGSSSAGVSLNVLLAPLVILNILLFLFFKQ